jgi:hypothetical protein
MVEAHYYLVVIQGPSNTGGPSSRRAEGSATRLGPAARTQDEDEPQQRAAQHAEE